MAFMYATRRAAGRERDGLGTFGQRDHRSLRERLGPGQTGACEPAPERFWPRNSAPLVGIVDLLRNKRFPTSADPAASCINGAAALWGDGSSFVLGARGPVMKSQFRLHPLRLTINGGPTGGPG